MTYQVWYGTVYLLHFSERYYHAQHYIGFTERDSESRLEEHLGGFGSPLVNVVAKRGIVVVVAREWTNVTRDYERWLKNQNNSRRFCPLCFGNDPCRQLPLVYHTAADLGTMPVQKQEALLK